MGVIGRTIGFMLRADTLQITPEILSLIARIDEFKGAWRALGSLAPDRLSALRRVATIESIGSSTRIEGSKLSDKEVGTLLSNLALQSFQTRDEQEVAGYAELMDLVLSSWRDIPVNENHVKQLHIDMLGQVGTGRCFGGTRGSGVGMRRNGFVHGVMACLDPLRL